jgi:hypothetical protein
MKIQTCLWMLKTLTANHVRLLSNVCDCQKETRTLGKKTIGRPRSEKSRENLKTSRLILLLWDFHLCKRSQKAAWDPERNIQNPVGQHFEGKIYAFWSQQYHATVIKVLKANGPLAKKYQLLYSKKYLSRETCTQLPDLDSDPPWILPSSSKKIMKNLNFNCFVTS